MPKTSKAMLKIPRQTTSALQAMGSHLAVARMRRRESLASWAKRIGVSIPTLSRMETGDPTVAMGIYATALWLIRRDGELARIASPEFDQGALELDVGDAIALGEKRARSAERSRVARVRNVKTLQEEQT